MGHPSDPAFLVLHAVRLRGFAEADVVARITCLESDEVARALDEAREARLLLRRDGRLSGYTLTAAGRDRHQQLLAEEAASGVDRDGIERLYQRFLGLNAELLVACTAWQLRPPRDGEGPQVLNDHTDAAHDAAVIEQLRRLDDDVQPVCEELAAVLDRFCTYGPRLARARRRLEAGELEWFTKPLIDSYHTVWFELHEDLLCTLGIERSKENPQ